jgi:hypothetical protein
MRHAAVPKHCVLREHREQIADRLTQGSVVFKGPVSEIAECKQTYTDSLRSG